MKLQKSSVLIQELVFFGLTFYLGIWVALRTEVFPDTSASEVGVFDLLIGFLIGTAILILLLKLFRGRRLPHQILFGVVLFGGLNLFWGAFFGTMTSFVLTAAMMFWRFSRPSVLNHNLLIVFALAGVAGSLGVGLAPFVVVVLLIMLSVYDYIAVYKTKHMVAMAKTMIEHKVILGFVIPEKPVDFGAPANTVQLGRGFVFIGGGDVALPLILVSSVVPESLGGAIFIAAAALLGVFADHYIFTLQDKPRPMPALPLIAFAVIFGYLIYSFF